MTLHQGPQRFGAFIGPYKLAYSPTVSLQQCVELCEAVDRLGFNELWVGEHHSGGYQPIASPELFLASVAERTQHVKLGTGVTSLPYHNPFTVASRMTLLDHLSRGRAMLGVGPGALASDAYMLDIPVSEQRDRYQDAVGVVLRLLDGEAVTAKTEWYSLKEARLQIGRYASDSLEVVPAATVSPTGPKMAGSHGLGMLNLAAMSDAGFDALKGHWGIVEEEAALSGRSVSREKWRLMGFMHVAETMEDALRDVEYGLEDLWGYFAEVTVLGKPEATTLRGLVEEINASGAALIGTPDMVIEKLRALAAQSGGFGGFLMGIADFADHAATLRSVELFANHVIPEFRGQLQALQNSFDWVVSHRGAGDGTVFKDETIAAIAQAQAQYDAEKAARSR